jgi:putative Mg2+ transporter-C (MgtC) family protein
LSNTEMILRLALAAVLASIVGIERERLQWAAGLRTHMLVSVGACLFMIVSAFGFTDALTQSNVSLDPSRVAAQVVSGIGFLGAGTILFRGEIVKGLTTAASLWAVAAVGLASGSGLYVGAIFTTALLLLILAGVKPLEERFRAKTMVRELRFRCEQGVMNFTTIREFIGPQGQQHVQRFVVEPSSEEDGMDEVTVTLFRLPPKRVDALVEKLRAHPGIVIIAP